MSDDAFPILTVDDLPAAVAFYERLGFATTYRFPPEGPPAFMTVQRGGSTIGLGDGSSGAPERFAYWVYVNDVDATVAALRASGARVVAEPEDQPWGERVARVLDPAGTIVVLGAALPAAG